jgi:lipopolysaccharide export system permease protein
MKILSRYLVKEFLKPLIFCEGVLSFLLLAIDFVGGIDNFLEAKTSASLMMSYYALKLPLIMVQMLPPATLIAVILSFSFMRRNNELLALKACGMNIQIMSLPVLVASLFVALALFLGSELIVPITSSRANRIWRIDVDKQDPSRFLAGSGFWYKGEKCFIWMRQFDRRKMIMVEPSLQFLDEGFRLIKKIDAKEAVWKSGRWEFRDGILLEARLNGDYEARVFQSMDVQIPETPDTFAAEEKKPEEMSYWRLKRFVERLRSEGYPSARFAVDLQIKLSFPFIVLIMTLIGIPIALAGKRGGAPLSVALGLLVCLFYLLALGTLRSFGIGEVLPPFLAAWIANGMFLLLGVYLMMNTDR